VGFTRTRQAKRRQSLSTRARRHNRSFSVELLENRYLLSGTPLQEYFTSAPPNPRLENSAQLGSGALIANAPFPLEQTFSLHSLPGATKTIYLDFDGHLTRETAWNDQFNVPNILTLAYSLDDDYLNFSEDELLNIQSIWERVSEDYRPFNVNVTTEDPGVDALRQLGENDDTWGQRVVIGGSDNDWYDTEPALSAGGVSFGSFNWDSDTPNFAFAGDFVAAAADPNDIAEVISHEVGHSLGLAHDSQFVNYLNIEDPDKPELVRLFTQYYAGHGTGSTHWAPIMGVGYGVALTQWSKGEYFNATNDSAGAQALQDDLDIITNRGGINANGTDYRDDDHGSSIQDAAILPEDATSSTDDQIAFAGEGIIERNTDKDVFELDIEGLGGIFSLDVSPFANGANLDVLAKILDSSGNVIATSNPIDDILAGGQTLSQPGGGWQTAPGVFTDSLFLTTGKYYVSIEGAGRPITFVDPAYHPGPIEATGNPPDPPLPPDTSDWGYSNYGSLGYYSFKGFLKTGLVVGVDFDTTGSAPQNWNSFTGGTSPATLTNLITEAGGTVPYELLIESTSGTISTSASSNPIDPADLPSHGIPLDDLDGYVPVQDETLTFTWTNLEPWSYHQIYVFGHADFEAHNVITISGSDSPPFTQIVDAGGLAVNQKAPGNEELSLYSVLTLSDASGQIQISVTNEAGFQAGIAGLAIAPTQPIGPAELGSLSGQKINDANGNGQADAGEVGLEGWAIYIDQNNNGQLDQISSADQTVTESSVDIPQAITDYTTRKSEIIFGTTGTITDLNVTLDISHTYDADVEVFLVSPAGKRVKLVADVGFSNDNFSNTTFDDQATLAIDNVNAQAPYTGSFRPQEPLSLFNGDDIFGSWKLEVSDDATSDGGVLNSWSMTAVLAGAFEFLEPFVLTDENGGYSFDNLVPGFYNIREFITPTQEAAGWEQTFAPDQVTVTSGAATAGVDFGNWIPISKSGSIAGQVFNDVDGDGVKDGGEGGLSNWIVYFDQNGNGIRDLAVTPVTFEGPNSPAAITDFGTTTSAITVPGMGSVSKISVTVDIDHSFMGDLEAYLISPSGRTVELFSGVGGQYNDFDNLTLDDDAAASIATLSANDLPYSGTWRPEGNLGDFVGDDSGGDWTLRIRDNVNGDEGSLVHWQLHLGSGEVFTTTDSNGNYKFDNLPAGNYPVRQENKPAWSLVPPADTSIPAAEWNNSRWNVAVVAVDNPADPDGPDSHRNVKNVDFGNHTSSGAPAIAGDFDRSGAVGATDYILWRKSLGSSVASPFSGADGDGDGVVDNDDNDIWRAGFGNSAGGGSGSSLASASQLSSVSGESPVQSGTVAPSLESAAVSMPVTNTVATNFAPFRVGAGASDAHAPIFSQRKAVSESSETDSALLAWLQSSRGDRKFEMSDSGVLASNEAESSESYCESIDSIFEKLGTDAV
jgi:subtilisin-like proprotein convertase family protein